MNGCTLLTAVFGFWYSTHVLLFDTEEKMETEDKLDILVGRGRMRDVGQSIDEKAKSIC